MKISPVVILIIVTCFLYTGCKEKDEIPPILTLNESDTLNHVLNSIYVDPGATAMDDMDGNISSNIYTENWVNKDKVGEYTVTYQVVDEAGNEAKPLTRWVFVYNQGRSYSGIYNVSETQIYPGNGSCDYSIFLVADSVINYGLVFSNFMCNLNKPIYAQVIDTIIVIPLQLIADTVGTIGIQGYGMISDTLIQLNYTKTEDDIFEAWNAIIERQK
jgi:hypothetical protein